MNTTNGHSPLTRHACLRSTKNHFMLAVNRPFEENTKGYDVLSELASDVCVLDEGSQVFVYRKDNFDFAYDGDYDEAFSGFAWDTARDLGNMAVDTTVESTKKLIAPKDFITV
jgi:hypothetical protein